MNDLSAREQQIQDYLKEVMKSHFPNADLRDDGEFMETFGVPHIKLFEPLLEFVDRTKLMQSLNNAPFLTEDEMNELGASYYNPRRTGERSHGYVTFVFDDIPDDGVVMIPIGITALSKDGLRFQSSMSVSLDEVRVAEFYKPSTFEYRVPVRFDAVNSGVEYDVKRGEISELEGFSMPHLIGIVNEVDFIGGVNRETNVEYATRIRNEMFAPNLGITRGYKRFMHSFPEVRDSLIAGYGHPLMKRDIIGHIEMPGAKFHENIRDLHWGTKVDVYIRGQKLEESTDYVEVKKDEEGNLIAHIPRKPVHDVVSVSMYSANAELDSPDIEPETLIIRNFTMIKAEEFETEGTLEEVSWIQIKDDRVNVGDFVGITYRYNELIQDINDAVYLDDARPPTADVKIKEANKKFVYGAMIAKTSSVIGLRDSDRSVIRQKLAEWTDNILMGSELQLSDMQEPIIVRDENYNAPIVDYIHLPFQLTLTENRSRYIYYCMSEVLRHATKRFKTENPFLHSIFEKYKDTVTTYDFFDTLHALTTQNNYDKHLSNLEYRTGDIIHVSPSFTKLREMTLQSLAAKRLSPPKVFVEEQEYYELGDMYIYEDRDYSAEDWERMMLLFRNISLPEEENEGRNDLYKLTVFVLTLVYMLTMPESESGDWEKMYEYIRKLVERTPIEFELNA